MRPRPIVLAVALFALVATACGGDTEPTAESPAPAGESPTPVAEPEEPARWQEEIVIGWTPPDITGVFQTATNFFEQAAEQANQNGFNVTVRSRSPATHTAFADQLAIIEDYVSAGVDAIAISPAELEAVKPAIRQANEAGIPVIVVNLLEVQEDIEVASYIGFDNVDAAAVSAYAVLDYFGGPGVLGTGPEVEDWNPDVLMDREWWEGVYADADPQAPEAKGVIIEGIAGGFFSTQRLKGFNSVVDQYPNVEVLAEPLAADWNREKAIDAAEDFLSRFDPAPEGELEFIWAASNEMGIGAMLTAERLGVVDDSGGDTARPDGTVSIFTNDVTPESVSYIGEGRMIAETHHGFAEWGWFGTEFAVKVACGIDVPQQQDIRARTVWSGNADLFYPDIDLPEIDWEEIKADCQ